MLCFPTFNFRCSRLYRDHTSTNIKTTVGLWKTKRGSTVFRTMNNIKLLNGFLVFSPSVFQVSGFQLTVSSYAVGRHYRTLWTTRVPDHAVFLNHFNSVIIIFIILLFTILSYLLDICILLCMKYFPKMIESYTHIQIKNRMSLANIMW